GEAGKSVALAQGPDAVATAGQNLVRIGLMADVPDQPVLRRIEHIVKGNRQLDHPQAGAEMAAGDRHCIHGSLAQFVGELAEVAALQAAHVSRRLDQIKERGLGGLGHEGRLRRRMGGDNLTGWLRFNQTGPQAQNQNAAKSLMHLAFSTGSPELALLRGVWSIPWGSELRHGTRCELER